MAFLKKIFTKPPSKKSPTSRFLAKNVDPMSLWDKISVLGDGAFGTVYKVEQKETKRLGALKTVPFEDAEEYEEYLVEVQILNECKHRNIVELYEAFEYDSKIWLFLEFCGGGALDTIMQDLDRPLNEPQIRHVGHELCAALAYLHDNNVIHRDLKAGNILLTNDCTVKLADFGVSARDSHPGTKHHTFIGTPFWMSPEVIACETFRENQYDCLADIWSFGITLIELAEMNPPHHEMHETRVLLRITRSDAPRLKKPSAWSALFSEFLSKCLVKDPRGRANAIQLLRHPFLQDAGSDCRPIIELVREFQADVTIEEEIMEDDSSSNNLDVTVTTRNTVDETISQQNQSTTITISPVPPIKEDLTLAPPPPSIPQVTTSKRQAPLPPSHPSSQPPTIDSSPPSNSVQSNATPLKTTPPSAPVSLPKAKGLTPEIQAMFNNVSPSPPKVAPKPSRQEIQSVVMNEAHSPVEETFINVAPATRPRSNSDVPIVVLTSLVSSVVDDVLLDESKDPSVPDCVFAAVTEFVGEQNVVKSQETPVPQHNNRTSSKQINDTDEILDDKPAVSNVERKSVQELANIFNKRNQEAAKRLEAKRQAEAASAHANAMAHRMSAHMNNSSGEFEETRENGHPVYSTIQMRAESNEVTITGDTSHHDRTSRLHQEISATFVQNGAAYNVQSSTSNAFIDVSDGIYAYATEGDPSSETNSLDRLRQPSSSSGRTRSSPAASLSSLQNHPQQPPTQPSSFHQTTPPSNTLPQLPPRPGVRSSTPSPSLTSSFRPPSPNTRGASLSNLRMATKQANAANRVSTGSTNLSKYPSQYAATDAGDDVGDEYDDRLETASDKSSEYAVKLPGDVMSPPPPPLPVRPMHGASSSSPSSSLEHHLPRKLPSDTISPPGQHHHHVVHHAPPPPHHPRRDDLGSRGESPVLPPPLPPKVARKPSSAAAIQTRNFQVDGEWKKTVKRINREDDERQRRERMERKKDQHQARAMQRAEQRQFTELLARCNTEFEELKRRAETAKEALKRRYDEKNDALKRSHKLQFEKAEKEQSSDLKILAKKMQIDYDKELARYRDELRRKMHDFEKSLKGLDKELKRQQVQMKREECMRAEQAFIDKLQEAQAQSQRKKTQAHKQSLGVLEHKLLQERQEILRQREVELWELDKKFNEEKHSMEERHLEACFNLRETHLKMKHSKESMQLDAMHKREMDDLRDAQNAQRKQLPKVLKEEQRIRMAMYRQSVILDSSSSTLNNAELSKKEKSFEHAERERVKLRKCETEKKFMNQLIELKTRQDLATQDLAEIHKEKFSVLDESRQSKMDECHVRFQEEQANWKTDLARKQVELERQFEQNLQKEMAFYDISITPSSTKHHTSINSSAGSRSIPLLDPPTSGQPNNNGFLSKSMSRGEGFDTELTSSPLSNTNGHKMSRSRTSHAVFHAT